jgi:hypothetical protein
MSTQKEELGKIQQDEPRKVIIKLVGMPPADVVDPSHTSGPGLASSQESLAFNALAFPPLLSGEDPMSKCIDTMDANDEDPFTLDSFESLVRMHMEKGKDFILARVAT